MRSDKSIAVCHFAGPDADPAPSAGSSIGTTARLATCQVQLTSGDAPEWIELVPAGRNINALDGRKFTNPSPE